MVGAGFVLSVGDEEFGSAEAELGWSGAYRFQWEDPGLGWSDGDEVSVNLVQSAQNLPAFGAPMITGQAQVAETLTADTSRIHDADGLHNAAFIYQWTANGSDISGATSSSYTLTSSEDGQNVRVRVSFTDDRGYAEALTSGAARVVAAPVPAALTVSLTVAAPTNHDGSAVFTFELRFSEEPESDFSYKTLKFHAFEVTGGTILKAQRMDKPSNIPWRITVRPDGDGDVTIVLPVTTDCGVQGAICTGDGRMLSNSLELTVSGPGG